jgi:ABC-2 type transport system ATP-binding protein
MSANEHAIVTHSLTKRFGRKLALDRVDAHIPKGSIYALLGPNGAGKTTFVRLLLNLMNPTRGSASVLGQDVVRQSVGVRRRVGHVASLQPLWEWMSVRDFASFMAGCYGRWNPDAVSGIIGRVGIEMNSKIGILSRGQRALVALAVAIGHDPDLLLLDEALTGLDPIARREVLRNIIDAMHAEGRTIFMTGQDIADMERICDHVGFLVNGRLVMESPLDDLKARVKRLQVEHAADSEFSLPPGAVAVERGRRETVFTVTDFSPALADSLASVSHRVEVRDLALEEIFVDLAQAALQQEAEK